jgi:hypothetical protein
MWKSVAMIALAACSTNYMPQSRGHVSVVMVDGQVQYVRDGRSYPHGFLGNGLVDAVRGERAAEQAATEYHERIRDGVIGVLVGAGCMLAGTTLLVRDLSLGDQQDRTREQIEAVAVLGCSVLMMGSSFYAATAEPYRWDAINLFNDRYAQPPSFAAPPYAAEAARIEIQQHPLAATAPAP